MKEKTLTKKYPALFVQGGRAEEIEDEVAVEGSYDLYLNDTLVDTIVVSPADFEAHALGYAVTEGLVTPEEVTGVEKQEGRVIVKTASKKSIPRQGLYQNTLYRRHKWGEIPMVSSPLEVSSTLIIECACQISKLSESWKKTGGVHCSVLFDQEGRAIKAAEDIGRWNTVDKIVGYALSHHISLSETILGCSGRQPEGMVLKAARARIPIIITKAAVIDRGIEAAERLGITLIGFAREERFTIYAHPERIQIAFSVERR
jgi:FdhD protein